MTTTILHLIHNRPDNRKNHGRGRKEARTEAGQTTAIPVGVGHPPLRSDDAGERRPPVDVHTGSARGLSLAPVDGADVGRPAVRVRRLADAPTAASPAGSLLAAARQRETSVRLHPPDAVSISMSETVDGTIRIPCSRSWMPFVSCAHGAWHSFGTVGLSTIGGCEK